MEYTADYLYTCFESKQKAIEHGWLENTSSESILLKQEFESKLNRLIINKSRKHLLLSSAFLPVHEGHLALLYNYWLHLSKTEQPRLTSYNLVLIPTNVQYSFQKFKSRKNGQKLSTANLLQRLSNLQYAVNLLNGKFSLKTVVASLSLAELKATWLCNIQDTILLYLLSLQQSCEAVFEVPEIHFVYGSDNHQFNACFDNLKKTKNPFSDFLIGACIKRPGFDLKEKLDVSSNLSISSQSLSNDLSRLPSNEF